MATTGKEEFADVDTCIMVPGHAVYMGRDSVQSRFTAHWSGTFPGYQDNDEAELYWDHVRTGVLIAARASNSLLIFSQAARRAALRVLTRRHRVTGF